MFHSSTEPTEVRMTSSVYCCMCITHLSIEARLRIFNKWTLKNMIRYHRSEVIETVRKFDAFKSIERAHHRISNHGHLEESDEYVWLLYLSGFNWRDVSNKVFIQGYSRSEPDLVPIASKCWIGSNAHAVGWKGNPCRNVWNNKKQCQLSIHTFKKHRRVSRHLVKTSRQNGQFFFFDVMNRPLFELQRETSRRA